MESHGHKKDLLSQLIFQLFPLLLGFLSVCFACFVWFGDVGVVFFVCVCFSYHVSVLTISCNKASKNVLVMKKVDKNTPQAGIVAISLQVLSRLTARRGLAPSQKALVVSASL